MSGVEGVSGGGARKEKVLTVSCPVIAIDKLVWVFTVILGTEKEMR
jgi:hypothetical protein